MVIFCLVEVVEVLAAQVGVGPVVAEHVMGGGEHGRGDGNNGLLGTATGPKAKELSVEVGTFAARCGPGGLDRGGFEPRGGLA